MSQALGDNTARLGFIAAFKQNFREAAVNEILEALPGKKEIKYLESEVVCVFTQAWYKDVFEAFSTKKPIFLQHVFPGEIIRENCAFEDFFNSLDAILERADKALPINFQIRIKMDESADISKNTVLGNLYKKCQNMGLSITNEISDARKTQIFSIYINNAFFAAGLSRGSDNISPYNGGRRPFKSSDNEISRAEHKLLEALEYFDIDVKRTGSVLDLGASPGGWSKVMLEKGFSVTAVDPAAMSDYFDASENFVHEKMTAQEFFRKNPDKRFDILLNDMKMDAKESARIICSAKEALKPSGTGIMTFKISEKNPVKRAKEAAKVLANDFSVLGLKHLYNNRLEVTCAFAAKK